MSTEATPRRIISLIPAVTEMLFAIGAGPSVVGVSSFDRHPPDVERLPVVGALMNPDVERVLSLRPDLVVVYDTQTQLRYQLVRARIPTMRFSHAGLEDVIATVRDLGQRTGLTAGAENVARRLERGLQRVATQVTGRSRPRTALIVAREPQALRGMHASGGTGFLHEMLEIAGGENVFADIDRRVIQVSAETLLAYAPEVLIELRSDRALTAEQIQRERASWSGLQGLPAVRQARVHLLVGDAFVVPGPRVVEATQRLAHTLHPSLRRSDSHQVP